MIREQDDWDNLFNDTWSEWMDYGENKTAHIIQKNPVRIVLETDIILKHNATLIFQPTPEGAKDFYLYGNGHSMNIDNHTFSLSQTNSITIDNVHFINGTVQVANGTIFSCTNSMFTNSSGEGTAIALKNCKIKEITGCKISGFDTGISLDGCSADSSTNTFPISNTIVVSGCTISDCNFGINLSSSPAAIVDTTLTARSSDNGYYKKGVTANATCFLIDCDIKDFDIGSDMTSSGNTAIIGCIYQNKLTNLNAYETSVYDTRFIGGETAVTIHNGSSYFYDCVIEGDAATQSGFAYSNGASAELYIFNLERPYDTPASEYYTNLYQYSDRTVTTGKSEISNCTTGINAKGDLHIADTHIHDCETGIQSLTTNFYGNNLIEDCKDGVKADSLQRNESFNGNILSNTFADTHVDTIRNCSNNGLSSTNTTAFPMAYEWNNRLEIYECGNYGIEVKNAIQDIVVDVHDCKTGIYITSDATGTTRLRGTSKIYDNQEWNIYDSSTDNFSKFMIPDSEEVMLTGGGIGNVYMKHDFGSAVIQCTDLYSDGVYYLGTETSMYILTPNNLYGTVVFDTIDSGYTLGRQVALISNPDFISQMFAKKEGFVISFNSGYAVFSAGCDVTYDVTTNGGDTFDGEKLSAEEIKAGKQKRISYLEGTDIDFSSHDASKDGYEFVGWNTDKDAKVGLEADKLTAGTEDITLYAIYKKTININYHTYDTDLDYRTAVTLYNNEDTIELAAYNVGGDKTFVGYVLDEDATVSSADDLLKPEDKVTVSFDNLMKAGDTVTISADGLDIYCVYEKQGQLKYLKKDGTALSTESKTVYEIGSDNKEFVYTVRAGEPVSGFTFTGWKAAAGNSYAAGATLSTYNSWIVMSPVYVVGDEPTPEEPNPEVPTPENPTPETPNPEVPTPETPASGDPVIQPPTTEASITQAPAGPKTGDSTNPIGIIGLGILSLLGILVLTMKNKRKN